MEINKIKNFIYFTDYNNKYSVDINTAIIKNENTNRF